MKTSEIIHQSCCGQGLPIDCPKPALVKKVEALENEIVLLNNQLKNAHAEIKRRDKHGTSKLY